MARDEGPEDTGKEQVRLQPVTVDAVPVVVAGTVVWAVGLLVLLPFTPRLLREDHGWWLGMCVTGVVLGLLGIVYCRRMQRRDDSGSRHAAGG